MKAGYAEKIIILRQEHLSDIFLERSEDIESVINITHLFRAPKGKMDIRAGLHPGDLFDMESY